MSPPLSQLAVTRATATAVPSATTASKPRRTTSRLYRGSTTTAKSALLIHQSGPLIGLAEQPFEVERTREHLDAVVRARPFRFRAVPVELDAVAIGIRQVDRLADAVVARARQTDARRE